MTSSSQVVIGSSDTSIDTAYTETTHLLSNADTGILHEQDPDDHETKTGSKSYCCVGNTTISRQPHQSHITLYRRRWWILTVYCICAISQSTMWNTWSPINFAVTIAFGWSDTDVALIPAMSNIVLCLSAFYTMYIVETKGLRAGMVLSCSFLILDTVAWNFGVPLQNKWLIYLGSAINGVPGTLLTTAAPLLSVLWFPTGERTTATAIASGSSYIGTGLGFLCGPLISGANVTSQESSNASAVSEDFKEYLRHGIQKLVYFDSSLGVICILLVMVYFPSQPPKAPSHVAELKRVNFRSGLKALVMNGSFWLLNISYNVPNGCYDSWLPFISIGLQHLNVSESLAGWLGFASKMTACIFSIAISIFADHFKKRIKTILLCMSAGATVCMVILLCIQEQYITIPARYLTVVLYTLCIVNAACVNGATPLYYELVCECTYPVHEGLACTFVCVSGSAVGTLFFALFLVPQIAADPRWMLWLTAIVTALNVPVLFKVKEHYYRLEIDGE